MLSPGLVLREAVTTLESNNYTPSEAGFESANVLASAIAEDAFGVVALAVYDTFEALLESWRDAQSALSALLRKELGEGDPKRKEAYLVLFCLSPYFGDQHLVREIEEDITFARKFVILGQHLENEAATNINVALAPLLPLESELSDIAMTRALDELPSMLARYGINRDLSSRLVNAFLRGEPLMDAVVSDESP